MNKKTFIKIIIAFFVINMFYFISCQSYGAHLTANTSSVSVGVGKTKTIRVTYVNEGHVKEIGNNATPILVTSGKTNIDVKVGTISCSYKFKYKDDNNAYWDVTIKGVGEGQVFIAFTFNNYSTQKILVEIKKEGKATKSVTSSGGSSSEESSSGTSSLFQEGQGKVLNTNILSEDFTQEFDPQNDGGNEISQPFIDIIVLVVNYIVTILQIIGGVVFVLCIAAAGINGIFATNEGVAEDLGLAVGTTQTDYRELSGVAQPLNKKAIQKLIRRVMIGSAIMLMSSTIVKIVYNFLTDF